MSSPGRDTRVRLLAAIGSIAIVGLASGLTLPLVSVRLDQSGASGRAIAIMAMLPAVGTMAAASMLTMLVRRLGAKALLSGALVASAASLLVLLTPYSAGEWMLSRVAMGVAAGILYALGEARILEISGDGTRGRWIGLYAATLTGCQLAGPAFLAILGTRSALPLVLAAGLHLLALFLVAAGDWGLPTPDRTTRSLSFKAFMIGALPLGLAVLYFSMFDSSMLSLLPIYGLALGLPERAAVLLVTAVLLGDAALQVIVGWAADRWGRFRTHLLCGAMTCVSALWLSLLTPAQPWFWVPLFLMGGAAGGLYTLAIVQIGDRYTGPALIAANAFIGLLWGAGSIGGPLAGSAAMTAGGPRGLLLFAAIGALGFSLTGWLRPPAARPALIE